jgi:hypothetical protein
MAIKHEKEELLRHAERLYRQLELSSIQFDRIAAEVSDRGAFDVPDGSSMSTRIVVQVGHRIEEGRIEFRHEARVSICPGNPDESAAAVEATIVVQFGSSQPIVADDDVIGAVGQEYSHRVMYPYLREVVQSALTRIGIVGATMLLFRGSDPASGIPPA